MAVWTVEQLAAFLRYAQEDSLFELWWLVALRGLWRGETAGLRWVDVDLERRELAIAHQLVHTDEGLVWCEPKSAANWRTLALDPETVRLLRRHERAQRRRLGSGGRRPARSSPGQRDGRAAELSHPPLPQAGGRQRAAAGPIARPAAWSCDVGAGVGHGVEGGAEHAGACQHRADRRYLCLGAAAAVSRQRLRDGAAGAEGGPEQPEDGKARETA
nr:hypothetical protein [Nonomuraea phyllanthi]